MNPTIHATLARHDRHLQQLVQGRLAFSCHWLEHHASEDPELAAWLGAQLKLPASEDLLLRLPASPRFAWEGWRAYYRGEYVLAAGCFGKAWVELSDDPDENGLRADIALGFGKVYTRSGHWHAARAWLLHTLEVCRADERLFGLVQGYGALGELLLRGGQPQGAHACMSTAFHILPPGSGQQSRQLNYLASTLMRTGAFLRAESLLMTSLHMARDADDADSVWHALARLQFLALDRADTHEPADIAVALQAYLPTRVTPVAAAFLNIGRAMMYWRRNEQHRARESLSAAQAALDAPGQFLPCEQAWLDTLTAALEGRPTATSVALDALLDLTPVPAPVSISAVDRTWARVPLPVANGFDCLTGIPQSVEDAFALRNRFFI